MYAIRCPDCNEEVMIQIEPNYANEVERECMTGNIIIGEAMGYCGCGKEFTVVGGEFEWIEER